MNTEGPARRLQSSLGELRQQWLRREPAVMAGLVAITGLVGRTRVPLLGAVAATASPAVACYLLLAQGDRRQQELLREQRAGVALAQTIHERRAWPVPGGWALDSEALTALVELVNRFDLRSVAELGPGTSTIVLGRCCPGLSDIVGVEHDPVFAERVRALARAHGLTNVRVLDAPLTSAYGAQPWYDLDPGSIGSVDLLIVDGPPNPRGKGGRRPAYERLIANVRVGGFVAVDDVARADERSDAAALAACEGFSTWLRLTNHWILRRTS